MVDYDIDHVSHNSSSLREPNAEFMEVEVESEVEKATCEGLVDGFVKVEDVDAVRATSKTKR